MLVNLHKVNTIIFLAPINSLGKLEVKQLTRKNNHFCRLHLVTQFAVFMNLPRFVVVVSTLESIDYCKRF